MSRQALAVCAGAALLWIGVVAWLDDTARDEAPPPLASRRAVGVQVDVVPVEASAARPERGRAAFRTVLNVEPTVRDMLASQDALAPQDLAKIVHSLGEAIAERDQESVRLLVLEALRGGEGAPAALVRSAAFLDAAGMDGQALQWALEAALQSFGSEEASLQALAALDGLEAPESWAHHVLIALSLHVQPGTALLERVLSLTDPEWPVEVRRNAVQFLADTGVPVQAWLVGLLEDGDAAVRIATLDALLGSGMQLSPDLLGSMLAAENEPGVRKHWLASLGRHLDAVDVAVLARSGGLNGQTEMDRLMGESALAGRADNLWRELGWSEDEKVQTGLLGSLAKVRNLRQQPDTVTLEALERLTHAGASPFVRGYALEQSIALGGGAMGLHRDRVVQGLAEDPVWFAPAAKSWMEKHGRDGQVVEALQWALGDSSTEPQVLQQIQEILDTVVED